MDLIERIKILHNFLSIGNNKRVIEGAKKILKKIPNNSYVWNLCGLAYQSSRNHPAAIECFLKAAQQGHAEAMHKGMIELPV